MGKKLRLVLAVVAAAVLGFLGLVVGALACWLAPKPCYYFIYFALAGILAGFGIGYFSVPAVKAIARSFISLGRGFAKLVEKREARAGGLIGLIWAISSFWPGLFLLVFEGLGRAPLFAKVIWFPTYFLLLILSRTPFGMLIAILGSFGSMILLGLLVGYAVSLVKRQRIK